MKEVSGLDPLNYITLPLFTFDMALKLTKLRGWNSMPSSRLETANFLEMKGYNKRKSKKWLLYLDANNLYGWAMSQYLPTGRFWWLDLDKLPDIQSISPTAK
ncbi:4747_t:CDS:2 [Funneliformis geosporum]|nr:4747_t:CDS:2 [Funneliformis geosporum]